MILVLSREQTEIKALLIVCIQWIERRQATKEKEKDAEVLRWLGLCALVLPMRATRGEQLGTKRCRQY